MGNEKRSLSIIADAIEVKARAKINLTLDVLGKRQDGYHNIKTIMQSIRLYDKITVSRIEEGIKIICNPNSPLPSEKMPLGEGNTAYKAARLFKDRYCIKDGVKIVIEKNIPIASGLAGGSSDAAAVLKGLNALFKCKATEDELISIGCNVGSDVPFCIKSGTVLAEGIGDVLTELNKLPVTSVLLVIPDIEISTGQVYGKFDFTLINTRPDIELLLDAVIKGDITTLAKNMVNVLETVTLREYPQLSSIKERLIELGALGSIMSGSGPSIFGLFNNECLLQNAKKTIEETGYKTIVTETL